MDQCLVQHRMITVRSGSPGPASLMSLATGCNKSPPTVDIEISLCIISIDIKILWCRTHRRLGPISIVNYGK